MRLPAEWGFPLWEEKWLGVCKPWQTLNFPIFCTPRQPQLWLPSLAPLAYGTHQTGGHLKKNKVNQALNLNCSDINHSYNRLHLFIAFVCSARNLLDAPWRIRRLKNKNPYKIQALCPKCSAFPLNIFIHPQGGITCPSHCLPPSHPLDPFPSKGMLSLPQLLWPFQPAHLLPGRLADPPGMAEIQQQPHRQQGSGEEEVTCFYSWDQRGQKFTSKKS